MNKVTLSLVAMAAVGGTAQVQAADMTQEQKDAAIAAKKAAIDQVRIQLNAVSVAIEKDCPLVKDKYLLELSGYTKELNEIYGKDEILDFSEAQQAEYVGKILTVQANAIKAQNLESAKLSLDKSYDDLKAAYDAAIAETAKHPHVGPDYEKSLKDLAVEQVKGVIDAAYASGEISKAKQAEIEGTINTKKSQIANIINGIADAESNYNNNEARYNGVITEFNEAKASYDEQLQAVIAALPTPTYENWQKDVVKSLNDQYRILLDAKKQIEAAKAEGKAAEVASQLSAAIGSAKGEIQNLVSNKKHEATVEDNAKKAADDKVKDLQTTLDAEKAKLAKYQLTDCDKSINAVQEQIDKMQADINKHYANGVNDVSKQDYATMQGNINAAILGIKSDDQYKKSVAEVVANKEAQNAMDAEVATLEKNLSDAITKAKTASNDKAYNAAAYFEASVAAINKNVTKVKAAIQTKFSTKDAVAYQNGSDYAGIKKTISDAIATYTTLTEASLVAYNKAQKTAADAAEALKKLKDTAKDQTVTVGGSTYAEQITKAEGEIKAINDAIVAAKTQKDGTHKTAMEAAASKTVTVEIANLTASYEANKKAFDKNNAEASVKAYIKSAEDLIDGMSATLTGKGDPSSVDFAAKYGNQTDAISKQLKSLQDELSKLSKDKTDAEAKYAENKANAGDDDSKLLDAAANAIQVLADVNKGLGELEVKVKAFDGVAQAAAENTAAYNETITKVNAASDAYKTISGLRDGINTSDPAATYYFNALSDYLTELANVANKTVNSYNAHTSVADKKSLLDEKDLIVANAKNLADEIQPNDGAYTKQKGMIVALNKYWQEAYDEVSNGDLSDKASDYLAELAQQKEIINKLAKDAEDKFGKGEAVSNNDAFTATDKDVRAKLDEITNKSKTEYAKNVDEQNAAQNEAFDTAYKNASNAFTKSVNELNQFRTIVRADLLANALETNNLVGVHESIYAYADKLRELQSQEVNEYGEFQKKDKKYGADDVFFNSEEYQATAKQYQAEIEKLLKDFEDKVNEYAAGLITSDLNYAKQKLVDSEAAINDFKYAGKSTAFSDLSTLISEVTTAKNNGGTFAVQVDKQYLNKLAKAEVDKMANADINAACSAEKNYEITAVTNVYNAEKEGIGKLANIDTNAVLASLAILKSNTIDAANKLDATLANIPAIKAHCAAYYGTTLAAHSDVYANAAQSSADIAKNNAAYAEIEANLAKAKAVMEKEFNTLTQLYSLHMSNVATVNFQKGEADYYAKVEDAKQAYKDQSCEAKKGEFVDLDKKVQTHIDEEVKTQLIDAEIKDVESKIDKVKEEYNLAAAAVGLNQVAKYDVDGLYTSLKKISDNWSLPAGDKNKKSYDAIFQELLGFEGTVADMYKALNGEYKDNNNKVADATQEINELKGKVVKNLVDVEDKAGYNATLKEAYSGLVQHLRTKFDNTVAAYDAKQKAGHILFYKENFIYDLGQIENSLENGTRVNDLKADYDKFKANDDAHATLMTDINALNELVDAFETQTKDFESVEESEKTAEVTRLRNAISSLKNEIDNAKNNLMLPNASLTDAVSEQKANILTIQKSWTYNEVPYRLNFVLQDLEAAHSSMNNKEYTPATLTKLGKDYKNIYDLIFAADDYNNDAVDGSVVVDINGETLKKAQDIDYLKEAWPLLEKQIKALAEATETFASDVKTASVIKGDALHDGKVDVADYDLVQQWILNAKSLENVVTEYGEGAAYGGDVDADGVFTVADLARISNIIFKGSETGEVGRARARRSVETDDITVEKQTEETTVFGKTVQIAVNVTNNADFTAGQFDVTLPAGMKLVGQELTDRANGHNLYSNELADGKYRILASNLENSAFTGHNGALVVLTVEVGSDYAGGTINVDNAIFSDAEGRAYVINKSIGGPGGTTGIDSITAPTVKERIFSIGGMVKKSVQKGINIIVGEDGTARKVIKK